MERRDIAITKALRPRGAPAIQFEAPALLEQLAELDRLRRELEQQKRTFDLAMTASQMGTWRYSLADNVCVYDENAQRLYGLTEARFLHDAQGVKAKFHPDDLPLMWARVAAALDSGGDGKYDVEYRVRQIDGSWRWLSAWGLVEYAGDGAGRKPVAITGASRDLTDRKQADDFQRLLLDELNHRVKNTLATVQAMTAHTLRNARDLPSAKEALEQRIVAMARAHDLLTARAWVGTDLAEVIARAFEAFPPGRVRAAGIATEISSRHTLALSLALHELVTNAAKYGALSRGEGQVAIGWHVEDGTLHLQWEESGGPPVAKPTETGFGSRLLELLLVQDLGGTIELDYAPAGLRCGITAPL